MKYSPASIFHEGKMIEIQCAMEKLRADLEYHEQKIRLIKYELIQIDLSEISVCSISSYTEKDVEYHAEKITQVLKKLKENEKLLSDQIQHYQRSQRALDDERKNNDRRYSQ